MGNSIRKVGRIGDCHKDIALIMKETGCGMFVQVSPVFLREEKESVIFSLPGIISDTQYQLTDVLLALWKTSTHDHVMRLTGKDGNVLQIFKNSRDFSIKTGNVERCVLVDVGCITFFPKNFEPYGWLVRIFEAIEEDNKKCPENAYIF